MNSHEAFADASGRSRIDADFPLDLVVRTPGELSRRVSDVDFFLREATEKANLHLTGK